MDQVLSRLSVHTGLLDRILETVQPGQEQEGSGLSDLIEALNELQVAVAEQTAEIKALRSIVCGRYPISSAVA